MEALKVRESHSELLQSAGLSDQRVSKVPYHAKFTKPTFKNNTYVSLICQRTKAGLREHVPRHFGSLHHLEGVCSM